LVQRGKTRFALRFALHNDGREIIGDQPMLDRETTSPVLRIELFVRDLEKSQAFYVEGLGFAVERSTPGSYAALVRDGVTIGLNLAANLPQEHPIAIAPGERPGRGVEIVIAVRDPDAMFGRASASRWSIESPLTLRSWGLKDFRMIDPDGYYIRVNSLSPA
jgi:lactoylglutathione lyase